MKNFLEINYDKNMNMLSQAIKYCETNFLHEDLINELFLDNDLKKQLCIILISKLNSQSEANILVSNLIEKSGPIRETVSFKILDLITNENYQKFFQTQDILDIFTKAITDINPSVSRNLIEIIKYTNDAFYLYNNIVSEIKKTLNEIQQIKQNKSYIMNKKNFNLYWNLEAIISIIDKISITDELLEILKITSLSKDYTIREKTAKAANLALKKDNKFHIIKEILKNDNNIYIQKYI